MKRILVTGGAGFLGSHLSDRLLADGHHVTCLDDFSSGRADNIAHLDAHERFTVIEGCVTAPISAEADVVFNLACPASPPRYQRDPVHTFKVAAFGTLRVLEWAQARGARVIQASTSEIYGDPEQHPQAEGYRGAVDPTGPRACYDEGKRAAETLCYDFRRMHGLDVRVARIFNTYGPRMRADDGRVVTNLISQALRGAPMTLYGGGHQTRSFCYVSDTVEGLARLSEVEPCPEGPINLGNPGDITVQELADQIKELTGTRSTFVTRDLPTDDPRRRCPDITRAKAALGWEPTVDLAAGLAATLADFTETAQPAPEPSV